MPPHRRWNWLAARAGASSEFYEGSPRRPEGGRWPPEGGPASLEARGGGVHDGIGALPNGIGPCPLATVPARLGTVELARRPCGGTIRILRRLSVPPGGRRWPPEGGSASLEAVGGGVHDGIGALPDRIALCPLATVPARAGHGGTGSRAAGASSEIYEGSLSRRWPPEGGSASLEAMGGGVHDGIGALPDRIGLCPLATVLARAGHGGRTVELARRPCGGIVRILRRLSEPPGGWLGLSRGHGRRGARRNRTVARRNRALPARDRARKGWERWNWLAARAGASSEFYEGPWPPERPSHPPEATGGLPAAQRAFVKF